jgi:hypothetical protein
MPNALGVCRAKQLSPLLIVGVDLSNPPLKKIFIEYKK